ncbi:N-carbamoylputrescine amidase, partial [Vibrio parahaemolyticus]
QWFPELARSLALHGAEAIFYPTAIGSEPQDPTLDSRDHWQRTMQGHSAANLVPVIASNRVGTEVDDGIETTFYGSSFITDHT